jgi:hypothetical protein
LRGLAIHVGDSDDLSLRQAEGQRFRVNPSDAPCADNSDVQLLCAQCAPLMPFWNLMCVESLIFCLRRKQATAYTFHLSAAFRNHMHWSEFIGGDVVISPPCAWQRRYNASDIEAIPRIDNPDDTRIVETLLKRFPDFDRAYK